LFVTKASLISGMKLLLSKVHAQGDQRYEPRRVSSGTSPSGSTFFL
jgi:hypothetical protein